MQVEEKQVQNQVQPQATSTEEAPVSDLEQRLQSLDESQVEEKTSPSTEGTPSPESLPDLSELDLPTEQPKTETTESAPEPQQEELGLPDTPEAKKFAEDFKQYLGFDVTELKQGIAELNQYRTQLQQERAAQAQQKEMTALQQEWGLEKDAFDGRMNQIVERFKKYSPEMQKRLDTVEGAKLIWAKIEQESKGNNVPAFQRNSTVTPGGKKYLFSTSEISNMSSDEYARNSDRILKAYQLGLVDNSR